jgi:DNA-binding transcriptional ArsR family regulator
MCTQCYKLAADATRHKILAILKKTDLMSVTALTAKLGVTQPTTSHHLKRLQGAGLVKACPHGRERLYALSLKSECFMACGMLKGV